MASDWLEKVSDAQDRQCCHEQVARTRAENRSPQPTICAPFPRGWHDPWPADTVARDGALYVRGYNGTSSRWYHCGRRPDASLPPA